LYFHRNGEKKHAKEAAKYIQIGADMGIEEYKKARYEHLAFSNLSKLSTL
jgi:hypothetical protein